MSTRDMDDLTICSSRDRSHLCYPTLNTFRTLRNPRLDPERMTSMRLVKDSMNQKAHNRSFGHLSICLAPCRPGMLLVARKMAQPLLLI
jgi:hypothetical protein